MKQAIIKLVQGAIRDAEMEEAFPNISIPAFEVLTPDTDEHGHVATNVAMKLAPQIKKSPMEIAEALVPRLEKRGMRMFAKVEAVQPGFINFFYRDKFLAEQVELILSGKDDYWKTPQKNTEKIQVEFISANPTGPLTAANGRGGFFGDVLASVLETQGHTIEREYYINDKGIQVDILGESVARRYLQQNNVKVDYPEELYQGDYIKDLAKNLAREIESEDLEEVTKKMKKAALKAMVKDIKRVTKDVMGIKYNKYFSESSLYHPKKTVDSLLAKWKKARLVYEKDGALWMKTRKFGDDKDRVLIKSNGEQTYFLSDVLYLQNRLTERKYDRLIEVWGADHHGYVDRFRAAAEAIDKKRRVDFSLVQLVKLVRKGKEVKMSKRKGEFVTIESVVDEIGLDAARFFFLFSSLNSQMDLDLELAKEQSQKNPVYYVQYAHARMSGILRKAGKEKLPKEPQFQAPEELALIRELMRSKELLTEISESYDVHRLTQYTMELARAFHLFYDRNRVINNGKVYTDRLALVKATQLVLAGMLGLLGINAPKKM